MRTEKVFASIFVIGLILKFLHLSGANFITILTLTNIALLYFPLGFYFFSDKKIERQNPALSIIGGFFLSAVPIGILFKMLSWKGWEILYVAGVIVSAVSVPLVIYLNKNSSEILTVYYSNMLKRTVALAVLCGIVFFLPTTAVKKSPRKKLKDSVEVKV